LGESREKVFHCCLLLKAKLTTMMKLTMLRILSLALLAMTGVTAAGQVHYFIIRHPRSF
jgi:hypothetical protein